MGKYWGAFLLIFIGGIGLFIFLRSRSIPPSEVTTQPESGFKIEDLEKSLESSTKREIPEDVEKTSLKDVKLGGSSVGIATRKFSDGQFVHTVSANLPDLDPGTFYEGWLVRGKQGDPNFSFFSTGPARQAKEGWLLEYQDSKDYPDYKGVVITLETKDDKKPEKHILEGSF